MSEVENYFKTKELKKVTDEFRKNLKELNIALRMSYDICELNKEHVARHAVTASKTNFFSFKVTSVNPRILVLDFDSCYVKQQINAEGIIQYVTELGEILDSSVIIVQNLYSGITIPDNIGELKKDFKLFVNGYDTRDKFYYVNLKENFIENYLSLYNGVNSYLENIKENDKTFEYTFKSLKKERLTWSYYFKGFEGEIFINLENSFTFEVPSLEIKRANVTLADLQALLDETFEESENEVKIKSLIKPPNKHFVKYFLESVLPGVKAYEKIAEKVFTLLIEDMDAEEIESTIAQSLPVELVLFTNDNDYQFVKLFNVYFILDTQDMIADKYSDFHVALSVYEELVLMREHQRYKMRVTSLKSWISSIAPK